MKILFINHKKSQCGVYEIGNRIFSLIQQNILPTVYEEVETLEEYHKVIDNHNPNVIIYNYYSVTLPFLNSTVTHSFPNIKHIAIIHDQLGNIPVIENIFDAWIIHSDTNNIVSNKKFISIRPILRFNRLKEVNPNEIIIGTNGFCTSSWKMYDTIAEYVNTSFDHAILNINLGIATFGGSVEQAKNIADMCRSKIKKSNILVNITHNYFSTETELIEWLSKNTLNIYLYRDHPGVGGCTDLAISSQSSLCVNNSNMLRHIANHLGSCSSAKEVSHFINNYNEVKKLYDQWTPERMTNDYKKMIETIC